MVLTFFLISYIVLPIPERRMALPAGPRRVSAAVGMELLDEGHNLTTLLSFRIIDSHAEDKRVDLFRCFGTIIAVSDNSLLLYAKSGFF